MDADMVYMDMDDCELVQTQNNVDSVEKSLLCLDDMVLLKIMKHLSIVDLSNVAETCVRLENLSQHHFKKHHSSVSWSSQRNLDLKPIRPSECERVFKIFGEHVKTIKLCLWADFEFYEILVILALECKNVDTLILESIRMGRPLILCDPLITMMFSKLKRFVLNGCFWMGWCPLDIFFRENKTLEQLSVINCCAYNGYTYRLHLAGFRALKELRFLHCRNVLTESELQLCFRNNNINSLVLADVGGVNIFVPELIDGLLDTINTLTVDYFNQIDSDQILRLKNLKVLRLRCLEFRDIDQWLLKISLNNGIEELNFTKIYISKLTIEYLKKFKNLTRLRFAHTINTADRQFFRTLPTVLPQLELLVYAFSLNYIREDDIIYMYKMMPKLRRLCLFGCNSLPTSFYFKLVDILINDWERPKLELIPPEFNTLKSLKDIKNIKNNIWLRTDVRQRSLMTHFSSDF